MKKEICVIAGDIHYSLSNLEVADKATRMAINKANELGVPFIANGDTTDGKALLRAECVNALIETFKTASITPYVNIGNHCKIHSKGTTHALNFLSPYATIIDTPQFIPALNVYMLPYMDDVEELRAVLRDISKGSTIIMHQGLNSSNMGHYIQDHSALDPSDLAGFRTILSHYHARQDIRCSGEGLVGLASFIGAPYTVTYGESSDLPKGFQVLYDDGSLEFIPTNLRKHITIDAYINPPWMEYPGEDVFTMGAREGIGPEDLVWVKVHGPSDKFHKFPKSWIKNGNLGFSQDFRLDLIPTDTEVDRSTPVPKEMPQAELLDSLIDSLTNTNTERKERLKKLWKDLK